MKYWNLSKRASVLASCFIAVLCGATLVGVNKLQTIPASTGKVVILQADGVAPPPPPPTPKPGTVVS